MASMPSFFSHSAPPSFPHPSHTLNFKNVTDLFFHGFHIVPIVSFVYNIVFFRFECPSGFHLLRKVSLILNFPLNPPSHIIIYLCILLYLLFSYDYNCIGLNCLHVCFLPISSWLFETKIISYWSTSPQDMVHSFSSISLLNFIEHPTG